MKVNAYRCDNCGEIKPDDNVYGVSKQQDLFDMMASYPDTKKLDDTNVHCCLACYRAFVDIPAQNMSNRKRGEKLYMEKVRELRFGLSQTCVLNVFNKKVFKIDY